MFSLLALNSYNCYVTGIDASSKMIELCLEQVSENNKNRLNFILGNVPFDLPIDVGSFDIVFSSSVLEYIENVDETILKIKNL
ncbi:MAG: class I SAM-dependent methyltransferase [Saprospiraceae bacterium]|nr:class I SAM-dependent methyltransferase [Saprospiraceae bacterium]